MNESDPAAGALLQVRKLWVEFGAQTAVRDVSLDLFAGETLGLVGESGSGKSTLARAILRLVRSARGSVMWDGRDLLACDAESLRFQRRHLQIIFQDPLASLNPRMSVGEAIAEPVKIFEPSLAAGARDARVHAMLERVGLTSAMGERYPHEFSGGQCQRIGIARAMIMRPRLLICDEPVSSLDVSIQGQIVNLLLDLQRETGTAMLFISHNLAIVRHLSHRVLVMYAGSLVETAPRDALFAAPIHPYTRALLAAVPSVHPVREDQTAPAASSGAAMDAAVDSGVTGPSRPGHPAADDMPATGRAWLSGCAYRDRCGYAVPRCAAETPLLEERAPGHWVACHRSGEFRYS